MCVCTDINSPGGMQGRLSSHGLDSITVMGQVNGFVCAFLVCGFVHFLVLLNCQCDLELILDLICAFFVSQ